MSTSRAITPSTGFQEPLFPEMFPEVNLEISICLSSASRRARVGWQITNARSYAHVLGIQSWVVNDIMDPDEVAELAHDALKSALAFLETFPVD